MVSTFHSMRERGFTMTELLIVLAVVAILSAVAAPSFRNVIRDMSVRSAADELVAGLQFARSEAVRINQTTRFTLQGRTWKVLNSTAGGTILREETYSDRILAQTTTWNLDFSSFGTVVITSPAGTAFPAGICLRADGSPTAERHILFPAKATSPVITATCP
jgi:type II secretion system protein H